MQNLVKLIVTVFLGFTFLTACGQKGPLFLPGDPSQLRSLPPPQESVDEEDEDDDDEDPVTIQ